VFPGDCLIHKETANPADDDDGGRESEANDPSDWLKTYSTIPPLVSTV